MASVNWEIDNIICFSIVYGSVYILKECYLVLLILKV